MRFESLLNDEEFTDKQMKFIFAVWLGMVLLAAIFFVLIQGQLMP